ncbi:MAG: 16S rRNA (adenine(1518)-N(6)/adenine(1519)-N(6))-dimethyltransferase RsmA [Anaerolineae bacterium]|jgi:16S rRNA (adenine1518-N6/adenine1519-N6)-dimethyltransferase|nr:16S rRNA (adenine(1518)-N(6)/adenine(1519)-N(6))-dimethyltransferase RsmA [Anaerolineae bacterium]
MTNPKQLLEKYDIQPKKSLGQNFLNDPNALEKIITVSEISPQDTVLEIGAGTGALTDKLAQSARRVVAVELDDRLFPVLAAQMSHHKNVELHLADILQVNLAEVMGDAPYVVVANVPYYITSAILRHLLETTYRPTKLIMTIQTEVAERVIAKPPDMSVLAVSVQFYGTPDIVARFNPAVFYPRPEVGSAVLRVITHPQPIVDVPSEHLFFRVVRAGFGQKRKQLKNALAGNLAIKSEEASALCTQAGIDPMRRAETLTLEEWASLTRVFANWRQSNG